jgi:hypothetical protein
MAARLAGRAVRVDHGMLEMRDNGRGRATGAGGAEDVKRNVGDARVGREHDPSIAPTRPRAARPS